MKKHKHFHHHKEVSDKSVHLLIFSFIINMLLSIVEFVGGVISGSMALIGDALHNTSDAISILIAVAAFKIGNRKADKKYTYGFKRAEVIGGLVNLILLFISGIYLLIEGVERLIFPQPILGELIIIIAVLSLLIDALTAKISHHDAAHNTNMKMVFVHNLADAFGSIGVIISGVCVMFFNLYSIDGIITLIIAGYMIWQAVFSFPHIVNILMNAAPDNIDINILKSAISNISGVTNVHHIHLWCINEHDIALECHINACDLNLLPQIRNVLQRDFHISHCNIQIEQTDCDEQCNL